MKLPKPSIAAMLLVIVSLIAGVWVYFSTGQIFFIGRRIFPNHQANITLTPSEATTLKVTLGPPTAINIPKIGKNLPIKPATVRGNNWDMFGDAVAWLSTSAVPGNGNVILYAHNWVSLWGDLYLLQPGDTIDVEQDRLWKTYRVTESRAIDQHDTQSILSVENRLTLYTCEGSFDQKRRLVYAVPID